MLNVRPTLDYLRRLESELSAAALDQLNEDDALAKLAEIVPRVAGIEALNLKSLLEAMASPDANFDLDPNQPQRLIICQNASFFIEFFIWAGQHTVIHDHGFPSVVWPLEGQSFNVNFSYDPAGDWNGLRWGALSPGHCSRVGAGSSFYLTPKTDFIHRVYHLDEKCFSLRVGLSPRPGVPRIQHSFFYPGLNFVFSNDSVRRFSGKPSFLRMLYALDRPAFDRAVMDLLRSPHLKTTIVFLIILQGETAETGLLLRYVRQLEGVPTGLLDAVSKVRVPAESAFAPGAIKSPLSALLQGLWNTFGFSPLVPQILGKWDPSVQATELMKRALVGLATSATPGAAIAWKLLNEQYSVGGSGNLTPELNHSFENQSSAYLKNTWGWENRAPQG
jgi:hypothetical protein